MDVKKEFVLKALDDRIVFTELCREYGIGRTRSGDSHPLRDVWHLKCD